MNVDFVPFLTEFPFLSKKVSKAPMYYDDIPDSKKDIMQIRQQKSICV